MKELGANLELLGFNPMEIADITLGKDVEFKEYDESAFVMENVSGMVKGKMKLIFAEIMSELKASGYKVSARLMNATYFGGPQSRERMIFIGVREDLC